MASKQGLKLFDVKNKLISGYFKLGNFLKYFVLRRKKQILIIGNQNDPIISAISAALAQKSNLTLIDDSFSLTGQDNSQGTQFLQLQKDNFSQIEKSLAGKAFNSIIVSSNLHQTTIQQNEDFTSEYFAVEFTQPYSLLLARNILAYRLAHKYLTKTGTVILSCSQKQFVDYKRNQKNKSEAEELHKTFCENQKENFLTGMVSSQVAYLGVVMGDREYTHLHSKSVVGLTTEVWKDPQYHQAVVQRYCQWAQGSNLPVAGSFALLKPAFDTSRSNYVEYL